MKLYATTRLVELANVVTSLPKLADGRIDADACVEILRENFSDLVRKASEERITDLARRLTGNSRDLSVAQQAEAEQRVMVQYSELTAAYNDGAAISADGLVAMLPQLFK
jgi:hypothetical protein